MPNRFDDYWQRLRLIVDKGMTCANRSSGSTRRTSRSQISELEPRILFSASPLDASLMGDVDQAVMVAPVETTEQTSSDPTTAATIQQAQTSRDIIVIDSQVPDLQKLLDDIANSGRESEVFVLDANRDGVDQISEILKSHQDVDSLHIVSHAENGAVRLGSTWLGNANLDGYAGQIAQWQNSFSADADILLYGCDLAATKDGLSLIEGVSALSGADVAASIDDTGHASYGANWDLEYATGSIDAQPVFSAQLENDWYGKLATITVTTFADEDNGTGLVSLREAIDDASVGDTIDLGALGAGTFALSIDTLNINSDLTITGLDARSTIIDASAVGKRGFEIRSDAIVNISAVTIQGGNENNGGGIFVDEDATLNLSDARLTGNTSNKGGAIHVHGTANLDRVLLDANFASEEGGAIHFHNNGSGSLNYVTISGNTADGDGGGIWTESDITITNSTITLNHGQQGGGIYKTGGFVAISNTIVAGNTADTNHKDVRGWFDSDGFNLIEVVHNATGFDDDITGFSANLAALADNGGPTDTHALQTGSLAINTGSNVSSTTFDQRGALIDAIPDIGAFEQTTATTQKIYWGESGTGSVFRANEDGTAVQRIVDFAGASQGLEVDAERGLLYFINTVDNQLYRSNLDGTNLTIYSQVFADPAGIGFDHENNLLYVADSGGGANNAIYEINLATLVSTRIVNNFSGDVRDVVADPSGGKIYFSTDEGSAFSGRIRSFDLVGPNGLQTLVSGETGPRSLEIDAANGKIYWADDGSLGFNRIRQANLADGSDTVSVATSDLNAPFGLDINATTSRVYWTDAANAVISSQALSGGAVTDVITNGLNGPREIAVVSIQPTNSEPTLENSIADQNGTQAAPFSFQFDSDVFADIDGDTLSYSATLVDGSALPTWLVFTAGTRTFSGTPTNDDVGTIAIRLTAEDGRSGSATDEFTITIQDVNDSPTDITLTQSDVDENADGAVVGDIEVVDPDSGDNHTLSVSDGRFEIVGTTLKLRAGQTLDHETEPTVTLTITATDQSGAGIAFSKPITIAVNDVNESPTITLVGAITSLSEDADTSSSTKVADVNVDDDALGTNVLTLSGADASLFELRAGDTELHLKSGASLDFQDNPTLDVIVSVDDTTLGGNPDDSDSLSIDIDDANDNAPVIDASQVLRVSELASNGTSVGFVTASDEDTVGATTNWAITGGNVSGIFSIDSATGEISVSDATNLDHDTTEAYILSIQVEDGANTSANQTVTIEVWDEAEVTSMWFSTSDDVAASGNADLPAWNSDQVLQFGDPGLNFDPSGSATAGELSFVGFAASNFGAAANVRVDAIHYVWSGVTVGHAGNEFALQEGDLLLSLDVSGITLNSDTEADKTFDANDVFVFRATTVGDFTSGDFFHLLDDPMGVGQLRGISVVEKVGGVTVGDTTLAQGTFLLTGGDTTQDDEIYTFEATSVGLANTVGTTQLLLDGESPEETANGGNLAFSERFDGLHLVETTTTLGNTTLQAGDLLVSTWNAPSIAGRNMADQDIVLLRMATTRIGDDHSTATATLLFDGDDVGLEPGDTAEDIDAVTLFDGQFLAKPISAISDQNNAANEVSEAASIGDTVGITAFASDDNPGDTVAYSLDDTAGNRFAIDSSTGVVTLDSAIDFEAFSSHEITVRATSSDTSFQTLSFTINVLDANEAPTVTFSNAVLSLTENTSTTTSVKVADVQVDDDALGTNTLTLTGADASLFELREGDTELHIKAGVALDFESNPSLDVVVEIDDNTLVGDPDDSAPLSIAIDNINEAPTDISIDNSNVDENDAGADIGTLTVDDQDNGDTHIWSVDDNRFEISGNVLRLKAGQSLDAETEPSVDVEVTAIDQSGAGLSYSETLTIVVNNLNEAPTVTVSNVPASLSESTNTNGGSVKIADITIDDDSLGTNTLTLTGNDAGLFEIAASGSELHLRQGAVLDFETNPSLDVTVNVDDATIAGDPDDSQAVTILVTDANEAPTDIDLSNLAVTENDSGAVIGTLTVADDDLADVHTWAVDDSRFEVVGTQLKLKAGQSLDAESEPTVDVEVTVTDQGGFGNQHTEVFTIAVGDINESPVSNEDAYSVRAGETLFAGSVLANDLDPDSDTLSAVQLTGASNGRLTFNPDGTFVYVPAESFFGTEVFVYSASDGSLSSDPTAVTIEVTFVAAPLPTNPDTTREADSTTDDSDDDSDSDEPVSETGGGDVPLDVGTTIDDSDDRESGPLPIDTVDAPESSVADKKDQIVRLLDATSKNRDSSQSSSDRSNQEGEVVVESPQPSRIRGASSVTSVDHALMVSPGAMWTELDQQRQFVESQIKNDLVVMGVAGATASSFTVAILSVAMRTGLLASGLLAQMPAWKSLDPLLVMQGLGETSDAESLEEVMNRRIESLDSENDRDENAQNA